MRSATVLAVVSMLVLAGQASAKEIENATVCGASGCEQRAGGQPLQWLAQVGNRAEPPGAAPFYTVSVVVAEPDGRRQTIRSLYVPSKHAVGAKPDGSATVVWFDALPQSVATLHALTRHTEPYPTARFPASPTSLAARAASDAARHAWRRILLVAGAGLALVAAAALQFGRRNRWGSRRGGLAPQP